MMANSPLIIREIRTRSVRSPMRRPLRTSVGAITNAPLVLIDILTEQSIIGRSYLFSYLDEVSPLLQQTIHSMAATLAGTSAEPLELRRRAAQQFNLLGSGGIIGLCLSGLDVACWDILAKAANLPLARLLGGSLDPTPAYNSNGLGLASPEESAEEALELLDGGFQAVKVRLGHGSAERDLAVVRAIKKAIPERALLMSDFNHCLLGAEAVRRARLLDDEGLYWIEEPTAHDDYPGSAAVARSVTTPVQLGENFASLREMKAAIDQQACDFVMPDLERIGGVSGWMHAAGLAEAAAMPMSSHLFPELSSHLLPATPTRHWLEYVDWAAPILAEPLIVKDGLATPPDRIGNGLCWDEHAVKHYAAP